MHQVQYQKDHVRNTVPELTKELKIVRQLVACSVAGNNVNIRTTHLLKHPRKLTNISESDNNHYDVSFTS